MKRPEHNAGFTLVELIITLAAASILAITAGMTLVYGYSGWCRNNAAVELQRDATLAMYRLSRAIREASASDVTTSASQLTIQTTEFRVDGDHLIYDPNTGTDGDEVVIVDSSRLRKMSVKLTDTLKALTDRIYEHAGETFNIDSPKQLAEILFDRLNLQSIRVGKAGRSTDAAVLEQLTDQHPIIELILQYRTLSKLKNTYADKLGSLINPRTDRIHASFNQAITATGRLSSSDPNLQNIPIRTEIGRKIRSAFVPKSKTDCILSADYSQIELRLLAHFSKDQALMAAFAADQDIHSFVASQIYNVPIEEVTGEMRSRCKAVNFGIIYGQGAFGLSRSIGITQTEAKKFIDDYFARYSSIREFMDNVVAKAKQTGYA